MTQAAHRLIATRRKTRLRIGGGVVTADQSTGQVEEFPGLDLAYERAMASYHEIAARYDAANQRIDGLLTLTSTVTLAAPIVMAAAGGEPDFRSPLFVAAVVFFSVGLILGVGARGFFGGTRIIGPSSLYEDWLELSPPEFKLNGIYWAGEHFRQTATAVWRKSWAAHGLTVLFILEGAALLLWIATEL